MSPHHTAATVLAWWRLGVITAADVKRWADDAILAIDTSADLPVWLMTLSLDGPAADLGEGAPAPRSLGYVEEFCAVVETTDPADPDAVARFAQWVSHAAMGEDVSQPEVAVGYVIEHAEAYDEGADPLDLARQALRDFQPRCTGIAALLPWVGGFGCW